MLVVNRPLQGKRVLLVGGIPNLSKLYEERLKELGAKSVIHVSGSSPNRIKTTNPDIIAIIRARCSHKHLYACKRLGIKIVYIDSYTRSTYYQGFEQAFA